MRALDPENDVQFSTKSRRRPKGIPQVPQDAPMKAKGTLKDAQREPKVAHIGPIAYKYAYKHTHISYLFIYFHDNVFF